MERGPALPPYAGPRPPAEGTLPTDGEIPLQRWQIEQKTHNPIPPGARIEQGRALFNIYCSPCHGAQGSGEGPVAKVFVLPGNLRSREVQSHSDAWIYGTIRNGSNTMPRYGAELAPQQRWEVVQYIRSLKEPAQ